MRALSILVHDFTKVDFGCVLTDQAENWYTHCHMQN